ncbi:hypothetical protein BBK82_19615 [Lentzea guizhouensis]|uniref:Uncharacterized protein n=1 Tax=Lentzea guizhouensis TaxID=1586287 RepID=A0A1B2HJP4_9PSEU|nr:hypothetical protein [Lentzea guizhouensis]ANZ37937.1 hypothetical protein BBK82_19615 [Lentzea guizhouensis]
MNDTEQLIKEALGKLAERTPHPGPTLNAVRRKRKRHRNVFLIATAGVAAAAVLIFTGLVASDRYTPPSSTDAAAVLGGDQTTSRLPLKYAPHWLPAGYAEVYRGLLDSERAYVPAGAQGYPFTDGGPLTRILKSKGKPDTAGWDEVTVRGLRAWVHTFQGQSPGPTAEVVWEAQDWLSVLVRGTADVRQDALRVAESVRADAKIVQEPLFTLDGHEANQVWGSSPGDWGAHLFHDDVSVQVGTRTPGVTGSPITVRGKQGVTEEGRVAVLDGSVWVTVIGAVPQEKLVDLANKVQLAPSPDTSWIGRGL